MRTNLQLFYCFNLFIFSLISIVGCEKQPESFEKRILSFGTLVDVTINDVPEAQANAAIKEIERQLNVMHQQWHAWRPGNLMQLNQQLQSTEVFTISPAMLPLVEQSQYLSKLSLGYFNPAIGKLIQLWGFHRDNPELNQQLPSDEQIKALVASQPSMDDIKIDGLQVKSSNKYLQLDFGGYAKGYGLEQLTHQLITNGIRNALINAGGDIKAIGQANDRPWKVAIQHPQNAQALAWLELRNNESIFTSGNYQRAFTLNNQQYHHIIDPRTGYPSNQAEAVTVIHNNAAIADAAATALMVAKPEDWITVARAMNLSHVLLIDNKNQLFVDDDFLLRLNLMDTSFSIKTIGKLTK